MQIDWLSGFITPSGMPPGMPLYDTGKVLIMNPGGEIETEHSNCQTLNGTYDSRILVRSPNGQDLYLSGNPVKHLYGHNLYGPADPVGLYLAVGTKLREELGLFPGPATWEGLEFTGPRFTRLDLTRSYRFPNERQAEEFIHYSVASARTRHGSPIMKPGQATFGYGSAYWRMVIYSKYLEIRSKKKGHKLDPSLDPRLIERLLEWSEGVVRFELRLNAKELARIPELIDIYAIRTPADLLRIWERYYAKLEFNANAAILKPRTLDVEPEEIAHMKPRLKAAVMCWAQGQDLRSLYPRPTFYRYRQQILKECGIDISAAPVVTPESAQITGPSLDPSGWDPEPLESLPNFEDLRIQYPQHVPEISFADVLARLQRP